MILVTGRKPCIGLGLARKYWNDQEQLNKVEVVEGELKTVFKDGKLYNKTTLDIIRSKLS